MPNTILDRLRFGTLVVCALAGLGIEATASEVADATRKGDIERVRELLRDGADVNAPQVDGSTALHWAVQWDDVETASLLLEAGANIAAVNEAGATPMQLAAINGSARFLKLLLDAGADVNASLSPHGDTALMMAARTGALDAIQTLLASGAQVNTTETWGGTTALMWAVSEHHADAVALLIEQGADVNARSRIYPVADASGSEGPEPADPEPGAPPIGYSNGGFTPILFAAREGDLPSARLLVAGGADLNAVGSDGKDAVGLATYNGNYALASFLLESGSRIDHPDAEGFTPLFWAVDRRNMEWNPGFPWTVTADSLPLIRQLLDAGAAVNRYVDKTPRSRRNFGGSPRIQFATALMRATYSADLELVQLLLDHGADPSIRSTANETPLLAAAGHGWIDGYSQGKSFPERLQVIQLLVELGADVNWADDAGITPLMVAANMGDVDIIQYLVDEGADLSAHDLGKKNDGAFGGSIEPLMPVDYAIGVGTFRPNNAIVMMEEAAELMTRLMEERGIAHTTSECTLRAFTCGDVDPMASTPSEIERLRAIQIGHRVNGIVGGLAVEEEPQEEPK
ncbi:MAG: ankyrin repeat domain-containing protein [Acidobacteriota bacterium]|nr:ankyrin repeat domain-containing protein [Acidobacteriota bacterium]